MFQHVTECTRENNLLDLILTISYAMPIGSSDHAALFFYLNINLAADMFNLGGRSDSLHYDFFKGNYDLFRLYLQCIDWDIALDRKLSVSEMFNVLIDILNNGVDLFVPTFNRSHNVVSNRVPWLNGHCRRLMAIKNLKYRLWRRNRTTVRSVWFKRQFQLYRNFVKRSVTRAKSDYESHLFLSKSRNNKIFLNTVIPDFRQKSTCLI